MNITPINVPNQKCHGSRTAELFDQASEYPCQHTIQFQSTLEGCLRRAIGRYNIRHCYLPFS